MDNNTPKVSIIEKIAQNRKVIIKRTLQVAAGIAGAVLITTFLAKERFPDDSIEIEESDDGSFKVIDNETQESFTVTKDDTDEVQISEIEKD